jgi:hypothetical protein
VYGFKLLNLRFVMATASGVGWSRNGVVAGSIGSVDKLLMDDVSA